LQAVLGIFCRLPRRATENISEIFQSGVTKEDGEKTGTACEGIAVPSLNAIVSLAGSTPHPFPR